MTPQKIGIGIIGTGNIAHGAHIPGYLAISDECEIVAAAYISEDALRATGRELDIPHLFDDYHDLLRLDEVDAVSVCTSKPGTSPRHPGGAVRRQARVL